jgi:hypothetical protein
MFDWPLTQLQRAERDGAATLQTEHGKLQQGH